MGREKLHDTLGDLIDDANAEVEKKTRGRGVKARARRSESVEAPTGKTVVRITAPDIRTAVFDLHNEGHGPYCQNAFSQKAREQMQKDQEMGDIERKKEGNKRVRKPKDFQAMYEGSKHVSREGWLGIPAPAFRCALISACRLVNFKMTMAKLSTWIIPDGFDRSDGTPLVRIYGKVQRRDHLVKLASGAPDIHSRAFFDNWTCKLRVKYDADQFTHEDIANLLARAGTQVGIGEGRPDSKNSAGMGWGTFEITPATRGKTAKSKRTR